MKNKIAQLAVLCVLTLVAVSCERASPESSRVSLQLPTYSKVGALACTKCLNRVIVNVDGDSFPTIKYMAQDTTGTELSPEVVLDVPSGPARKIQILAIYKLSDGALEAQYGITFSDIFGFETPPITLLLNNLGPFKKGSVVGRYLTDAHSGPTGKVIISMNHESGMSMDLMESEILNGWFDFLVRQKYLWASSGTSSFPSL